MDLSPPPSKPPRGVKNSKETGQSGLLMAVIRSLSTSDSNEQRDSERTKLERNYKKSNEQLEKLVSMHHDDLTRVMNIFGSLSTMICKSKEAVRVSKDNLLGCKKLLTCRREELKKLWMENKEYKYVLEYLAEIERIRGVPSQLNNCMQQEDFGKATRLLVSAIKTSETTFKDVIGLNELRSELHIHKQELFAQLIMEVKEQIYIHATKEIANLKRQGSARDNIDLSTTPHKGSTPRQLRYHSTKLLDVSFDKKLHDNNSVESTDDTNYKINNLLECFVILDKGTEMLEELKQTCQRDLTELTIRTTQEMSSNDSHNILSDFFQVICDQFKRILDCHSLVLDGFKTKCTISSVYDLSYIWSKMQQVLQPLVLSYVEIPNGKKVEPNSAMTSDKTVTEQFDVNVFFTRRKYQRTIKGTLFKFDNSSQTDGISKILERDGKDRRLLCKPSTSNITQIYAPLSRFTEDISVRVFGKPDNTCKLSVFLNESISKVFSGKNSEDIANQIGTPDKNGIMVHIKDSVLLNGTSAEPLTKLPMTPSKGRAQVK